MLIWKATTWRCVMVDTTCLPDLISLIIAFSLQEHSGQAQAVDDIVTLDAEAVIVVFELGIP